MDSPEPTSKRQTRVQFAIQLFINAVVEYNSLNGPIFTSAGLNFEPLPDNVLKMYSDVELLSKTVAVAEFEQTTTLTVQQLEDTSALIRNQIAERNRSLHIYFEKLATSQSEAPSISLPVQAHATQFSFIF